MSDRNRLYYHVLSRLPDGRRLTDQAFRSRRHLLLFLQEGAGAAALDLFDQAQLHITIGLVHHAYSLGRTAAAGPKRLTIPVRGPP